MFGRLFTLFFLTLSLHCSASDVYALTLEEKVGQLFITFFEGDTYNPEAQALVEELQIGGVIYYNWANGLTDPSKLKTLNESLQQNAQIPLFTAIDQEGGVVARLRQGFTEFPGNGALGQCSNNNLSYNAALAMGNELSSVGINLNFAPVIDVNSNPHNPVIGIRSFSEDPITVAKLGREAVEGFKRSGVASCLKHFPGHGDTFLDSHQALSEVDKTIDELEAVELVPFRKLAKHSPMIMTAHVRYPEIDPNRCATLSPIILQDLLRNDIGFKGVVISDSLTMGGVRTGAESIAEVAIKAFEAGCDILLIGGRVLNDESEFESNIHEFSDLVKKFVAAIHSGRISIEQVDQSVDRILKMKRDLGLFDEKVREPIESSETILCHVHHRQIAHEIALESVSVKKEGVLDLSAVKKVGVITPNVIEEMVIGLNYPEMLEVSVNSYAGLQPSAAERHQFESIANDHDLFIIFSYCGWKFQEQLALIESLSTDTPVVCVAARDPYDCDALPDHIIKVATYSPTKVSFQVAIDRLFAESERLGVMEGKRTDES